MSQESIDKACSALNHMVEAANEMSTASVELKMAGDKATAELLDKIRSDFRSLRLEVAKRLNENL